MAEIDVDQLRRKIKILATVGIVNIGAFNALNLGYWIDGILCHPGNQSVAPGGTIYCLFSRVALPAAQPMICRPVCIGWKRDGDTHAKFSFSAVFQELERNRI